MILLRGNAAEILWYVAQLLIILYHQLIDWDALGPVSRLNQDLWIRPHRPKISSRPP